MSSSGRDDPLEGLPARPNFVWLLDRVGGTAVIDPNEFESHATPSDVVKAHRPAGVSWHEFIATDLTTAQRHTSPVIAVTGWRSDRAGQCVVTYTGADGKDYDLSAQVDTDSGRLIAPAVARSTREIDVVYAAASQLSSDDHDNLGDVLRACYVDVDEDWIERRLRSISDLAIAWRGEEIMGFSAADVLEAEVPDQRGCRITFGGLWIRPDARGLRLGWALQARLTASSLVGEFDFVLVSFASPVTFQMQFPGRWFWPGRTLDTALHTLATAPGLVRHLTAQAAVAAGSTGFDENRWIAHGLEHGTPNVTPSDIDPAITNLFRYVDQPNGDSLTIPASLGPPPAFLQM